MLLNVYATVACRRRLQKAPRRIHERLPRTFRDRRKALTKTPSSSGTCSKPATPKPRPGLAESGCAQEKAELYLLEKAGRCLGGRGLSPPTFRPLKIMTPGRAKPRANRRHCFPQGLSKGAQPLCRRRHSSSLLLNVYATVACRRRLQKAPRRIHERLPRTHSRPAQGLDKDPKLVWDMLEAGNAKAAPGLAESGCAQEKAELYLFRRRQEDASAAGAQPPGFRPGKQ